MKSIAIKNIAVYVLLTMASGLLHAQTVKVEGAWLRVTVPGQKGTGGFMRLTAGQDLRLVGVASPVAGVAEVHEMKLEGEVMKMRAVSGLDLPAGKAVELKPGGYHVMLMDLKDSLKAGSTVPVKLLFKDKTGKDSSLDLQVPVLVAAPGSSAGKEKDPHAGHGEHKH